MHADAAKLVSRTVLSLIAAPPAEGATAVLDGVDAFVQELLRPMNRAMGGLYLRKLLVTWLMDSVNIITTYLSAPAGLPLPAHAGAVVERGEAVCTLLDRVSASPTKRELVGYLAEQLGIANASRLKRYGTVQTVRTQGRPGKVRR
ncbi:hypothetical protein ACWF9B_00875 [Streptomyces sp. NPDC055089]